MKDDFKSQLLKLKNTGKIAMPADLRKALNANKRANATWNDLTEIARRDWILWVISGKLAKTRKRRIEKACDMLSSGKRRVCCFGGMNWLIKTEL